jgi:hypothetical protein
VLMVNLFSRRWRCLRLALTASLVDLLGGDVHTQTSRRP